jgi:ubiquinone/menaquinone biosynthesis C-methylase UbiE
MFSSAGAYDRFMGRYSTLLAPQMADVAGVAAGQRVLDVGSGPGALTAELVRRVGEDHVAAVDPSEPFIAAVRERYPGVDARVASAEVLPFEDAVFDAAIAQLVVHFMREPVAGMREMARVTRRGGTVATCVWDHATDAGPLAPFWRVARELEPSIAAESRRPGASQGDLVRLMSEAGLHDVRETTLTARLTHPTFDAWWEPFELGVGPAGTFVASLAADKHAWLIERLRGVVPAHGFTHDARAWAARGTV